MAIEIGELFIRPTVGVYATYQRLSYKPWFAIAEFVDNSTQSYYQNREALIKQYHKEGGKKLKIEVIYDPQDKSLEIIDNAFGMEFGDFSRALILDSPPDDRSGRSEFGMGLKTAACWFGKRWMVETTRLGSERCFIATVDVDKLAKTQQDNLDFKVLPAEDNEHYTLIRIEDVQQPIRGRTATRVKEQLSSIYRVDLRSGEIQIYWNGELLEFKETPFLEEQNADGSVFVWKKNVLFTVPWERKDKELSVKGWIGIRNPGKAQDAGIVLLRRGRVILGGPGQGYKPHEIFGNPNQAPSQRLVGELGMDDWPVTQAKDGFDWNDGLEEEFIVALKSVTKDYVQKSIDFRASENRKFSRIEFERVAANTKKIFENKQFTEQVEQEIQGFLCEKSYEEEEDFEGLNSKHNSKENLPDAFNTPEEQEEYDLIRQVSEGPFEYRLQLEGHDWVFKLYWQDVTDANWMSLRFQSENEIEIFLNINHPFFAGHINSTAELELLQRFLMAMALAEKLSRLSTVHNDGFVDPADFRLFMNKILRWTGNTREVSIDD
ncbi:ATP-binding protein [Candidatus Contubernalis alkaliaceticus]|uniref:ATP-binding protein n=1 Tax=Candidatus Contubernalis alkaliaceticus TaxID=338645 RepID=UPI001F4C2A09|nr:ATP-binding protein [Candidatus Contubernalis alkalaceticus]UNC91284.1 ATP-binding protein [Candidatus Contubernalis alkalaceticus]